MIEKSYAKVNIFLKIAGLRGNYHELVSRFVKVYNLYDTIIFEKSKVDSFTVIGNFSCTLEKNTIYKAYLEIKRFSGVEEFFKNHIVKIEKNIPEFAGLGGGSSNAAVFLNMVNNYCNLGLNKDNLSKIGEKIGADVPFFIYDYDSANVSGIGEIVEKFDEDILDIEIFTPKIECNTGEIFKIFRESFYKEISYEDSKKLFLQSSKDILSNFDIKSANDLYEPAKSIYPSLENFANKGWFFSGSGSSFFRINNGK
ncbi:4-(cytidine 5'-diphospho)-2-C-methyl-D-erythritol kinase [Aliarcobacter lanthieri]|uniref:4-(cytidine 5'-diphospho)-2-C-methyl-D-erythritol kinase n=1 Tax=Aliarcobacter lanthieri TaxID=1355374 RepID=UPI003AAFA14C